MTFYSKILESALFDVIPDKMEYGRNLVYEMVSEIIDKSFDFRKEGACSMHDTIKACMRACEFIENENISFSETEYSAGIDEIWRLFDCEITGYLSEYELFNYMDYTLEDYIINPVPVQAEMINIFYRAVANEVNDFLWEKFF